MKPKSLFLILAMILGLLKVSQAQDFYRDYKDYLLRSSSKSAKPFKHLKRTDSIIKWTRLIIDKNRERNEIDLLSSDTIHIVVFYGAETASISEIVWNKLGSCYYTRQVKQKPEITLDASDILKSFNHDFRTAVENIDTAAYHVYADTHKVYDGEYVGPMVAIKKATHWIFIGLKGNEWAINVDFEPPKK